MKIDNPAQAAPCGADKNLNCIVIHGRPIQGFYIFLQSVDLKSLGYARHYRLLKEKQKLTDLEELKKSVLKSAFAGKF